MKLTLSHIAKDQRGSVIAIALIMGAIIVATSLSITHIAVSNLSGSTGLSHAARAFYIAESGVEMSLYQLSNHEPGFQLRQIHSFPSGGHVDLSVIQRTNTLPVPGTGDGVITLDAMTLADPNSNLLTKGSAVTIPLGLDEAEAYTLAANVLIDPTLTSLTVSLKPAARDVSPNKLKPGMTRINEVLFSNMHLNEDSTVQVGDPDLDYFDEHDQLLQEITLHFHPNDPTQELWQSGDPLYFHADGSSDFVTANDVRLNTAFVTGDCDDIYVPTIGKRIVEGSDCDVQEEWELRPATLFGFIRDSQDSIALENEASVNIFLQALQSGTLSLYNDVEEVTVALTAQDPASHDIVTRFATNVYKNDFDSLSSQAFHSVTIPLTALSPGDLNPKLTIFSPIRDVDYTITATPAGEFADPTLTIQSFGFSNLFRQKIEMKMDQIASIPLFNYTVAF